MYQVDLKKVLSKFKVDSILITALQISLNRKFTKKNLIQWMKIKMNNRQHRSNTMGLINNSIMMKKRSMKNFYVNTNSIRMVFEFYFSKQRTSLCLHFPKYINFLFRQLLTKLWRLAFHFSKLQAAVSLTLSKKISRNKNVQLAILKY